MSLRVDIVCGTYPPDRCGVADYTRRLCAGLRDLGVDARVVTTCGLDAHADPAVPADCLAKDWGVRSAFALARNLAEREPDIVHVQFPAYRYHGHWGVHVLPMLLSRSGVPVITTLHEYCMAPWGGRLKQLLNVGFSRRVIVTNAQDRELIGRWMPQERLDLIPIGSNIPLTGAREHGQEILHSLGVSAANDVALFFDNYGIMIRSGFHCAQPLHQVFKLQSSARASFYIYNTREEIDRFTEVLKEIEQL